MSSDDDVTNITFRNFTNYSSGVKQSNDSYLKALNEDSCTYPKAVYCNWEQLDMIEVSAEQRLMRYFSRFDPAVRPVYNHSNTVHVSLSLQIAQLDHLVSNIEM